MLSPSPSDSVNRGSESLRVSDRVTLKAVSMQSQSSQCDGVNAFTAILELQWSSTQSVVVTVAESAADQAVVSSAEHCHSVPDQ